VEVIIEADAARLASYAADAVTDAVRRKPTTVLGLATGSSPAGVYDDLVRGHQEGLVSFARVRAFLLDEYVGLPPSHPQTYRNVIEREFVGRVDLDPAALQAPDGQAENLTHACDEFESLLHQAGGVDLQLLGLGTDGHIAFNEPGSSLASLTRLKTLTEQTRRDNARFFGGDVTAVPRHVLTQGLGTIMRARHVVLLAVGGSKARAVRELVEGAVSARWPATVLQMHPHVTVLIDEAAASQLELAGYYREVWRGKPSWQAI
jgi:glucosamine-6-phosphate deaminase